MRTRNGAGTGYSARKAPRQSRSKFTVESIKQATLALIDESGFEALSTVAIAARAGISVGSLYQYFPNREAILLAIYEETTGQLVEAIKSDLPAILDAPLPQAIHRAAAHLLSLHKRHQRVLLELPQQMPELKLDNHPVSFDRLIHGTLRLFLTHRSARRSASEIDCQAFFIEQILLGSIHRYLLRPPPKLGTRQFLAHVTDIIVRYLEDGSESRQVAG